VTDGQTDRRTDRILIARPRLHFMQRRKNNVWLRSVLVCCWFTELHGVDDDCVGDCMHNIISVQLTKWVLWSLQWAKLACQYIYQ